MAGYGCGAVSCRWGGWAARGGYRSGGSGFIGLNFGLCGSWHWMQRSLVLAPNSAFQ